jgi:hypothetical protein
MLNYIITENSITVLIKNIPEVIDNSHPNFKKVESALKNGASEEEILRLMNVGEALKEFAKVTEGNVEVKDGEILYKGEIIHSALSRRIISLMNRGFDITPFTNFMENLYKNPSNRAVNETYGFLEACNLPITEDGCFLAYKKITKDYVDCYTKTIDNSIGKTVEVPRNKVDEDSNVTCSYGLHVASYSYMAHYLGDRIVICKVNPADVVAVPSDYNNAKMRVCRYEVINEVNLKDEEIPDNVISDKEAFAKELQKFNNIDEMLEAVKTNSFKEIKNRIDITTAQDEDMDKFIKLLSEMNNRTKFWRNTLLDTFSPIEETETKMNFKEKVMNNLREASQQELNAIHSFLLQNSSINNNFIAVCLNLGDYKSLTKAIAKKAKKGEFRKKDFLSL